MTMVKQLNDNLIEVRRDSAIGSRRLRMRLAMSLKEYRQALFHVDAGVPPNEAFPFLNDAQLNVIFCGLAPLKDDPLGSVDKRLNNLALTDSKPSLGTVTVHPIDDMDIETTDDMQDMLTMLEEVRLYATERNVDLSQLKTMLMHALGDEYKASKFMHAYQTYLNDFFN